MIAPIFKMPLTVFTDRYVPKSRISGSRQTYRFFCGLGMFLPHFRHMSETVYHGRCRLSMKTISITAETALLFRNPIRCFPIPPIIV